MQSRDQIWWRVRLWDENENPGDWSSAARFEIGLNNKEDWTAQWVGFPGGWSGYGLYFETHFQSPEVPEKGRCYFMGSWSELYLNGVRLGGNAVLQPAQTDFGKSVHYLTFDITSLLKQGENVLAVHTGHGWYGTPIIRYQIEDNGKLLTQSHILSLPHVYPSPVTRNSIYDGEEFDARRECDPAWKLPGKIRFPVIRNALRISGPSGKPRGLEEEAVYPVEEIPFQSCEKLGENHYIFDFGKNFSGWCRLHVQAPAGTEIEMIFAETLYDDKRANQENLLGGSSREIYTAAGNPGGETYEPHFTYHGFRYVEVKGLPVAPDHKTLTGIAIRTGCSDTGSFLCGDQTVNDIFQMIKQTESSNLLAVPTDCPQRTERMGWLNDLMARCEGALYLFDESNVLTKWLRDIAEAQDPDTGEVPMTAPLYWGFEIDPVCSSFIEAAWLNYAFYGKYDLLEELYPHLKKWVLCMLRACDPDGIMRKGGFVGDWCPPTKYNNGSSSAQNHTVPHGLVSTAIMHYAILLLERIAGITGKQDEQSELKEAAATVQNNFLKVWKSAPGELNVSSQSAYAYAIYCGIFPEEERPLAAKALADLFRKNGCKHSTGNIGTKYLLEVLALYGYEDLAWKLIRSKDYPGWGYMLENGATTLWERWELAVGYGMNSHNHPMLGAPAAWLFRHAAGIRITETTAGFDHFLLAPKFLKGLNSAGADYQSRAGLIHSAWKRIEGKITYEFQIPPGSSASVRMPDGTQKEFYQGKYQLQFTESDCDQ